MATYNQTSGTGLPVAGGDKVFLLERTVDWSSTSLNGGAGTITSDVINLILIPDGCVMLGAGYEIITASTLGSDFDLLFTSGTALDTAIDFTAAAGTKEYYTELDDQLCGATAKYLRLEQDVVATVVDGVVRFFCLVVNVGNAA